MINQIINKKWFLVVSSFFIAIMLFAYARELKNPSDTSSVVNVSNSQLVSNLPVIVNMDQDKFTVSGLPETVSVRLDGNSTKILLATTNNAFRVETPDLNELGPGQHVIAFKVTGLNEGVVGTVTPAEAEIVIEAKKTIEMPVTIDVDSQALSDVYEQGEAKAKPSTVVISGSQSLIAQVNQVSAKVILTEQTTTDYTVSANVEALDASGVPLDVSVSPETVEVHVPITAISKVVPIKIIKTGKATNDFQLKLSDTQVTLVGSRKSLQDITYLPLLVDISKFTKTETKEITLDVPNDIETIIPNKINLIIEVDDAAEQSSSSQSEESSSATDESSETESKEEQESQVENNTKEEQSIESNQ